MHIAGQVAWDEHGRIVDKDDLHAQTFQAFRNLQTALRAAGGTLEEVVSLRIYIAQVVIGQTTPVKEGLLHFFPHHPPAATWIGVPALANPGFLIEIEALAVLD